MDSYDLKDLLLCIEGLGRQVKLESDDGSETVSVYQKGPDSLGCLQDIQRFLRRDDLESKAFHVQLGTWNVLSVHLLPMLAAYRDSHEYCFEIVKLMVMMTMPAEAKMRDPTEYNRRLAVYLESFVNHDILAILMSISAGPLSRGGAARTHNDIQVLELILTLFRNLLLIIPSKANVRDELLFSMDKENILLLLLHIASQIEASENARFSLLILETFRLLFANQDPLIIASITEPPQPATTTDPEKLDGRPLERKLEESGLTIPSLHSSSASTSKASSSSSPSSKQPISARGAALGALLSSSSPTKTSSAARHSRFGGYVLTTPKIQPTISTATILGMQLNRGASDLTPPVNQPHTANGSAPASNTASTSSSSVQQGKKKPLPGVEFNQKDGTIASSMISIMDVLNPKLQHAKGIRLGGTSGRGSRNKAMGEETTTRRSGQALASSALLSGFSSKLILKNFAHRVLDHCYNELMRVIKALVESHSPNLMANDLDNFVWAIGFFPAFLTGSFLYQRNGSPDWTASTTASSTEKSEGEEENNKDDLSTFDIGSIHTIFEEETFYYLLEQLERYETEKVVSKVELHFLALKQLIYVLLSMHNSGSSELVIIAENIVMKLIYDPELLIDRLPRLVATFSSMKKGGAASLLLPPLVEGVHLILSLLEKISDNGQKKLVQLKKRSKSTMDKGVGGSRRGGEGEEDEYEDVDEEGDDKELVEKSGKTSASEKESSDQIVSSSTTELSKSNPNGDSEIDGNASSELPNAMEVDAPATASSPSRKQSGDNESYFGGSDDGKSEKSASDDEFAIKAKRLKEELDMMEEADDDEDNAKREKYFDVQDYYIWFVKKHVVDAIVTLLQTYETNLDRTNDAVIGILSRVEQLEGLAMLFQVNHLRIIASILIEKTSVEDRLVHSNAVGAGASRERKEKVKAFCRKVAGAFLEAFYKDPVTIGLTTLWPKKLSHARDLISGNYLTNDSFMDGTLDWQEEAWVKDAQRALDWDMEHNLEQEDTANEDDDELIPRRQDVEEDDNKARKAHSKNPSSVKASRHDRARPYLAEGMEGDASFDISSALKKPKDKEEDKKARQESALALLRSKRNQQQTMENGPSTKTSATNMRRKKTPEERQDEAWSKFRSEEARPWNDEENEEIKALYFKYKETAASGGHDVLALVKSMVKSKSFDETLCTLPDLYVQLEKLLPAEEFQSIIKRPEIDLEEEEEKDDKFSLALSASSQPTASSTAMDIDQYASAESTSASKFPRNGSSASRRRLMSEEDDDVAADTSSPGVMKQTSLTLDDGDLELDEEDEEEEKRKKIERMNRLKRASLASRGPTSSASASSKYASAGSTVNVSGGKTARQVLEEMAKRKKEREEEEALRREENAMKRAEEMEERRKAREAREEEEKVAKEQRKKEKALARLELEKEKAEAKERQKKEKEEAKEAKKKETMEAKAAEKAKKAEERSQARVSTKRSNASSKGRAIPTMDLDGNDIEGEGSGEEGDEANPGESSTPTIVKNRPRRQASRRAVEASHFQQILERFSDDEEQEEEDKGGDVHEDKDSDNDASNGKKTAKKQAKKTKSKDQEQEEKEDEDGVERDDDEATATTPADTDATDADGVDHSHATSSSSPKKATQRPQKKRKRDSSKNDDDEDFTLEAQEANGDDEGAYQPDESDDDDDDEFATGRGRGRGGKKKAKKAAASTPAKKKRKLAVQDAYEDEGVDEELEKAAREAEEEREEKKRARKKKLAESASKADWASTEETPGEASTTIIQKKRRLVRNAGKDDEGDENGETSSLNSSFVSNRMDVSNAEGDDDEILLDDEL